jgi:hypothetical protein
MDYCGTTPLWLHRVWTLEARIIEAKASRDAATHNFLQVGSNFVSFPRPVARSMRPRANRKLCGHYYAIFQRGDIFSRSKNGLQNLKRLMILDLARER